MTIPTSSWYPPDGRRTTSASFFTASSGAHPRAASAIRSDARRFRPRARRRARGERTRPVLRLRCRGPFVLRHRQVVDGASLEGQSRERAPRAVTGGRERPNRKGLPDWRDSSIISIFYITLTMRLLNASTRTPSNVRRVRTTFPRARQIIQPDATALRQAGPIAARLVEDVVNRS